MADVKNINLLPYEQRAQERFVTIQKKVSVASVVVLCVVAIATLATLVFYTSLASKRAKLLDEITESTSTINANKNLEEMLFVVSAKATAADKLLTARAQYPVFFGEFAKLIPQGVYFSDIKIASNKLVASGKAASSGNVRRLHSSLQSENGKKIISSVAIDSLNADEKGVYSFVLSGVVNP